MPIPRKRKPKETKSSSDSESRLESVRPVPQRTASFTDIISDQITKKEKTRDGRFKYVTRRRIVFLLGTLLGFLTAGFFATPHGQNLAAPYVSSWTQYLSESFEMGDIDWGSLLPENTLIDELFGNFTGNLFPNKPVVEPAEETPGFKMREKGAKPKHPVIFVPGIISSGLESWSLDDCSRKYFRKRLWGTMTMFRSVLVDRDCWLQALKLDETTGLDPKGFKLRASKGKKPENPILNKLGLEAADYFISGYWLWAKFIENFAFIGYDTNNMYLASYDWRLSYANLERRDLYFSKLKNNIEIFKKASGEKAVVLTHSMGSLVWYYFLKWVESDKGGKGGSTWVEDNIHATANIAGALLGALKTVPSMLSGEQRETVQPMAQYVLEKFFSRQERASLFRSWGGLWSLIPKGGETLWGDYNSSPDDPDNIETTFGKLFILPENTTIGHNFTVTGAINLLMASVKKPIRNRVKKDYSFGVALSDDEIRNDDPAAWANPLETSLPVAPSMKFYCFYGYGLETERAYHIDETPAIESLDDNGLPFIVDVNFKNVEQNLDAGIKSSEGDGSVNLLSLGYMCVEGWKKKRFNPSGLKLITREFNHTTLPIYEDIRGGPKTSEHVDILGNHALIEDILKIASGFEDNLEDRIESNILKYSKRVKL